MSSPQRHRDTEKIKTFESAERTEGTEKNSQTFAPHSVAKLPYVMVQWQPRAASCKVCGAAYTKVAPTQVRCLGCQAVRNVVKAAKNARKLKARRQAERARGKAA